jgi:hypothetical protein
VNVVLASSHGLALHLMADDAPANNGPDFGKASPFGLVIVVVLLIGTIALVWSMNRHLKKLPESFDRDNPEPDQAVDDGTVEVEPTETPADPSGAPNGAPREPGG